VTTSKDNTKNHRAYKEFFDKPRNYHLAASNSSAASSEFFKTNAPKGSVARPRRTLRDSMSQSGGNQLGGTQTSFHGTNASGKDLLFNNTHTSINSGKFNTSVHAGSPFATPFIL
jgi:hypothetical protein